MVSLHPRCESFCLNVNRTPDLECSKSESQCIGLDLQKRMRFWICIRISDRNTNAARTYWHEGADCLSRICRVIKSICHAITVSACSIKKAMPEVLAEMQAMLAVQDLISTSHYLIVWCAVQTCVAVCLHNRNIKGSHLTSSLKLLCFDHRKDSSEYIQNIFSRSLRAWKGIWSHDLRGKRGRMSLTLFLYAEVYSQCFMGLIEMADNRLFEKSCACSSASLETGKWWALTVKSINFTNQIVLT